MFHTRKKVAQIRVKFIEFKFSTYENFYFYIMVSA